MIPRPSHEPEPHERVSEERERARALAEVLRDQAERAEAVRQAEMRAATRTRLRRGILVAVWAAVAWIWLGNPAWTRIQPPSPPPLAEDVQALRVNLFLQTQQVEAFREARGRLPWVLQEAGPPLPGMEYRRQDSRSYEIHARSRRVELTWASDRPAGSLSEAAAAVLVPGRPVPTPSAEAAGTALRGETHAALEPHVRGEGARP